MVAQRVEAQRGLGPAQTIDGLRRRRLRCWRSGSPADPHTFTMRTATAAGHFVAGRYDEALAWAEAVTWDRPGFLIANIVIAAASALAGRQAAAAQAVDRLRGTEPALRLDTLRDHWPIHRSEDLARWREGLARAGLPA